MADDVPSAQPKSAPERRSANSVGRTNQMRKKSPKSTPADADAATMIPAEESTPLLGAEQQDIYRTISRKSSQDIEDVEATPQETAGESKSVFGIISVLLVGVFVSQADVTLVMATLSNISSEFGELERGSWLLSSALLASCVTQPMYGKFSDIFGRKAVLQTSYIIFALGTLGSGMARSMTQMIIGRVIQGAGGAGTVSMVSILLTDLVPLQEVAVYRSYVNIFSTVGRSCGGLLGGYLTQAVGWRWAFLTQIPLLLVSIALVWWKLEEPKTELKRTDQSAIAKWKRIDFLGALFMSLTILPVMLALDMGGQHIPWSSPFMIVLFSISAVSAIVFCLVESYWATEPIFPLKLLGHYVVVTSYVQFAIQTAIQVALMFLVPLYFQATNSASAGEAGAHLVPSILGNTFGGLAAGAWIKRTGRYKLTTIVSALSATLCFTLLIILWQPHSESHGANPFKTSTPASLIIFFGGFGTGIASSSLFIGLTAGVEKSHVAIAASGLYLSGNVGAVSGVSLAGAVFHSTLRERLSNTLSGETDGSEIVEKVLSDVGFLRSLHGRIHDVVVEAFVFAVQRTFDVLLIAAGVTLVIAVFSRQTKIAR